MWFKFNALLNYYEVYYFLIHFLKAKRESYEQTNVSNPLFYFVLKKTQNKKIKRELLKTSAWHDFVKINELPVKSNYNMT